MNTPLEPLHSGEHPTASETLSDSQAHPLINPDDPPWTAPMAIFVWLSSFALIAVVPSAALMFYGFSLYGVPSGEQFKALALSPRGIVVQVAANFPAHLLTLLLVWMVATGAGRRPFWRTIGWTWTSRLSPLQWVGAAALLWALSNALTQIVVRIVGADETAFDRLIESSSGARIALAVLAVLTAPLIEEIVYRGVVYPAFQRSLGVAWAIVGVAGLFAVVHVPQYWNNPGLIFGLAFLSVALTIVRARTGSVLPCFVIHFVFNFISATLLLLEPTLRQLEPKPPPTAGGAKAVAVWLLTNVNF